MALTAARLDEFRRLLNTLSLAATGDLRIALAGIDMSDFREVRGVLDRLWPDLVLGYGQAAGALGATLFEMMADDLAVSPSLRLAREDDGAAALARMRWAVGTPSPLGNLATVLDELVKQPARDTIAESSVASRGGWARVPRGGETCAFCRMLASRGAVYSASSVGTVTGVSLGGTDYKKLRMLGDTEERRAEILSGTRRPRKSRNTLKRPIGEKYHGGCDCATVFVRGPQDYPEGYDPDVYLAEYQAAGTGDTKEALAHMRAAAHTH